MLQYLSNLPLLLSDLDDIYQVMGHLERLSKQAKDILDCRIEAVLDDMSLTNLCALPEDDPVTVDHFLRLTEGTCATASSQLTKSVLNYIYSTSVNRRLLNIIKRNLIID